MKRIAKVFRNLKLNQKFSMVVFTLAFIPLVSLAVVIFINMQNVAIDERLNEAQRDLLQIQTRSEKTADLCGMTTQFFLNSPVLNDFLHRANLGDSFSSEELIAFYNDDVIGNFEKLVNSNPYLYQVRIYHSNTDIPEFFPILYHSSRMERLSWSGNDWASGTWQYDYLDTLFPQEILNPTGHIMSLVTEIEDYSHSRVGVLEVAVRMNELFPDLFTVDGSSLHGFVTSQNFFYRPEQDAFWAEHGEDILSIIEERAPEGGAPIEATLGGRAAIISSVPIMQFSGRYIIVMFRDDITSGFSARRNIFILVVAVSLLFLAFIVNLLSKTMLRRFYRVIDAINAVREGALSVEVPYVGDDEIGLLGDQVNRMLERIRKLMDENVKREQAAKNSDIRALLNQINAHFIYNVLETIKMMAEIDMQYEISDAITSLGKLLRYSMRRMPENVTLEEELEHLENYILLMNLRYDFRIGVRKDFPPRLYHQKIPKLTLQPIVENAVTHGIEEIAEDTVIELTASECEAFFTISVTDHGKGMAPPELAALRQRLAGEISEGSDAGIGLKNVHDRIAMAFGEDYGLSIDSEQGLRTSVTIRLPYID